MSCLPLEGEVGIVHHHRHHHSLLPFFDVRKMSYSSWSTDKKGSITFLYVSFYSHSHSHYHCSYSHCSYSPLVCRYRYLTHCFQPHLYRPVLRISETRPRTGMLILSV